MKIVLKIMTIVFAVVAVIGACGVDTEGTFLPYILAAGGMLMALICWKAYSYI